MIEVEATAARVRFSGELPGQTRAFVDADWLPTKGRAPVAPLFWRSGELTRGQAHATVPADVEAVTAVLAALAAVAAEATGCVRASNARHVRVSGDGIAAHLATRRISKMFGAPDESQPQAWIDFTGTLDHIREGTSAVCDLGLMVLAGDRDEDPGPIDLYADVHSRSLRLIGIGPILSQSDLAMPPDHVEAPVAAQLGEWIARGRWFELRDRPGVA